jgi:nicotinamidase-related amidase
MLTATQFTKYTAPHPESSVLLTIDMQRDFTIAGATFQIPGTAECVGQISSLLSVFRKMQRPIVHVVRLYLPDGGNVDACRREAVEQGTAIVLPGTPGAELVDELKPDHNIAVDADLLLHGRFQQLAPTEWVMYKPRWDAFYATGLEAHLREHGVDTVVFCGCNFPNCPRSSIYGASMRDFRIVMVTDAVSGVYEKGLEELGKIQVALMDTTECVDWIKSGEMGKARV